MSSGKTEAINDDSLARMQSNGVCLLPSSNVATAAILVLSIPALLLPPQSHRRGLSGKTPSSQQLALSFALEGTPYVRCSSPILQSSLL